MDVTPIRRQLKGRFISLARADLAGARFQACDGVPARFGVSIADLQPDTEGVTVTLSHGQWERFDLVVGADGLHSQARELTFGPGVQFESPLGCHVAAFRVSGYPRRDGLTYVSHTVPKRHVARVALRDDETVVLLIFRSELIDGDPSRAQQKAALRRAFGDMKWEVPEILDRMEEVDDLYFDRVSQIHLAHWSAGRSAVIGDAAACVSLLAGEGTGLAMLEAYVLAGELHRADGDVERALAPETRAGLVLRNVAVNAMSIPFLANRWIGGSLRDDFVLPDYLAS